MMKSLLKGVGYLLKGFVMIILEVIKGVIVWFLTKIIILVIILMIARAIAMQI